MESETVFTEKVLQFFTKGLTASERLQDKGLSDRVKVKKHIYVLKDFTLGKHKGAWKVIAGTQQQDIVLYSEEFPRSLLEQGMIRISGAGATGTIVVPLAICELKVEQSVNTHGLITYGSIAAHIKEIFPHCVYYFILDSNQKRKMMPETVLRQGKGFDRVFLEWEHNKETIREDLEAHLMYLKRSGVL